MSERDHEKEELAKEVADELERRIAQNIGRSVIKRVGWLLAAGLIALAYWLGHLDFLYNIK